MIEQISNNQAVFFKEYPCHHFAIYYLKAMYNFRCTFRYSDQKLRTNKPAAIIDSKREKQEIYLLQWKEEKEDVFLSVRGIVEKYWREVKMNVFPDFVDICGGAIFVVAGEEIFILDPNVCRTQLKRLERDRIVSVNAFLCHHEFEENTEPGVCIVYQNQKGEFYSGQYSLSVSKIKRPETLKKIISLFNKKTDKIVHLQVLIPNVLGLAFLDSNKMCVYNLDEMRMVEQSAVDQQCGAIPLVKWRRHKIISDHDQKYFILIGVGDKIFSYFMTLRFTTLAKENPTFQNDPLTNFCQGNIVDWSQINLIPYLTFVIQGNLLIDMAISTKGLIYYSKNSLTDLIGQCKYIDMKNVLNESSVLLQEASIWRLHYEDKWEGFQSNDDRLLAPNRYPYELVRSIEKQNEEKDDKLYVLNQWRKNYGFSGFLTYADELLIVRKGSISVFRGVEKELFEDEYLNSEQLDQIQKEFLNFQKFQNLTENFQNKKQRSTKDFGMRAIRYHQLIKQKKYSKIAFEDEIEKQQRKWRCQTVLQQVKNIVKNEHEEEYHSLGIQQFQLSLICKELQDKINYFHLVLARNDYRFEKDSEEKEFNKNYEKDSFIATVVDYFYGLYNRSAEFYNTFGYNLIDFFIKKSIKNLSGDVNAAVQNLLQLMMEHLFPFHDQNSENRNTVWHKNAFCQFLVNQLKSAIQNCIQNEVLVLRKQLSRIVSLGFFDNCSSMFSHFWRNQSLLKGLFLSFEDKLIDCVLLYELTLETSVQNFHQCYQKVKDIMEEKNIQKVQKLLYINEESHLLKIDSKKLSFTQWVQQSNDPDIIQKYCRINEDILRNSVSFQEELEQFDFKLLRNVQIDEADFSHHLTNSTEEKEKIE